MAVLTLVTTTLFSDCLSELDRCPHAPKRAQDAAHIVPLVGSRQQLDKLIISDIHVPPVIHYTTALYGQLTLSDRDTDVSQSVARY